MHRRITAWVLALLAGLSGCAALPAHEPERRLEAVERLFDTDGPITSQYHSTLYYPAEITIHADGYLVGIEKSPRDRIDAGRTFKVQPVEGGVDQADAQHILGDGKLMWVSHVVRTRAADGGASNCTIYNAYAVAGGEQRRQLVEPCDQAAETWDPREAYSNSWKAMERLKSAVAQDAASGRYTHVVVMVMGWNTIQEEATRNFNSIARHLVKASGGAVRPLVIGVTWPSQWNSAWIDPAYKLASFPVKSQDADELGLTWLGVLLHEGVTSERLKLPVVVIGHSFGSRASSVAACVGPAIQPGGAPLRRTSIPLVINLQGAFLTRRLFGEKEKGISFPGQCSAVANYVMTASEYDKAVNYAFWGLYAGGRDSYVEYCGKQQGLACARATAEGAIVKPDGSPRGRITYIDASALIWDNAYGTGGGAHSDVYRLEHGRLIYNLLSGARAPSPQAAAQR